MTITDITIQARNLDRVNVSVDGKYRFSLAISQVTDLGVKVGKDYTETELDALLDESAFGKLYARALEYSFSRPHSAKEMRDYLWRKTRETMYKSRTGELKRREGASQANAERTFNRLVERGYVNDETFAKWWVESRNLRKGTSQRKLAAELQAKGIDRTIIETTLAATERDESDELQKVLAKKRHRYDDEQKLKAYLLRQGFAYDEIQRALRSDDE
ncbi:MAG TPA: RecX family transcriptional regulator [Candidatus Saccharimonadales bacterium]|jgi:regulatory protein